MAYTKKTWSSEELATSTGLNQMSDNIEAVGVLHLFSSFEELTEAGSSYVSKLLGRVYIPEAFDTVRFGCKLKDSVGGANTSYVRLSIDSLQLELSTDQTSYTDVADTLDISSLSAGWYDLEIELKGGAASTGSVKGINVFAEVA